MSSNDLSRRFRSKARRLCRAMIAAYLLALFVPVSVSANLSLCVCERCSRLESCPMISCDCAAAAETRDKPGADCGCCGGSAITAEPANDDSECPSYLVPVSPAHKLKLPRPQLDDAHLELTLNLSGLTPPLSAAPAMVLASVGQRGTVLDLRSVRLLM